MIDRVDSSIEPTDDATDEPDVDERQYWDRWRGLRDEEARAWLLARHMPYARTVAAVYFGRRMQVDIEFDDYLQFASVGLIEALDRFDPGRGISFRTFAARRMHGTILDGVERLSDRNQQIALRRRLERERASALGEGLPGTETGAREEGADLFARLAEIGIGLALGILLEGTGMVAPHESDELEEDPSSHGTPLQVSYFRKSEIRHLRRLVGELLNRLSPAEQSVIRYHYLQENDFTEIARILGLSRGRVSQLHRSGLARLREEMCRRRLRDVAW